jgi:hypothetical protein
MDELIGRFLFLPLAVHFLFLRPFNKFQIIFFLGRSVVEKTYTVDLKGLKSQEAVRKPNP